jgi:peptide/nickel transport system permease protein
MAARLFNFFKHAPNKWGTTCSIIILIFFVLMALMARIVAPDGSPNANNQITELAQKPPGFTISILNYNNTQLPLTSYSSRPDTFFYQPYPSAPTAPYDYISPNPLNQKPAAQLNRHTFYLGTDKLGRDILSRILLGSRVSLIVGFLALLISLVIGVALGLISGYYGGLTDSLVNWFINVLWTIPSVLLVFALSLIVGKGFWAICIGIGAIMWVSIARVVRGQVLTLKNLDYIKAAQYSGFSGIKIMTLHILPNIFAPIVVLAANNFALAIIIESSLSFLGLGVQPPQPSWGLLLKENYSLIITNKALIALLPGVCVCLVVIAFNVIGNALADALRVKNL